MAEREHKFGPNHRILVDDTANTWELQFYDSAAAAWKTIMSYDTAAQRITRLLVSEEIADGAVIDRHVPTGEITFRRLKRETGSSTAVPDADTEIAHGLGVIPEEVTLVPQSTGVAGYIMESARSATSITVIASISGVDLRYTLIA